MDPEFREDAPLWNLLGKARLPHMPQGFTNRVLQTVLSQEQSLTEANASHSPEFGSLSKLPQISKLPQRMVSGLLRMRLTSKLASGLAALLLLALGLQSVRTSSSVHRSLNDSRSPEEFLTNALISQEVSPGDLALLAQLDEVVDAELASLWTESIQ